MDSHMTIVRKKDLVAAVSHKIGNDNEEVARGINALIEVLVEKLCTGNEITLRGFGTFTVKVAKAKKGRNPSKPEDPVHIPLRCVPRFRPGKVLRESIRKLDPMLIMNGTVSDDSDTDKDGDD